MKKPFVIDEPCFSLNNFKDYNQLFDHFKHSPNFYQSKLACQCHVDDLVTRHILQEHGNILKGKPKFFQSELSLYLAHLE
ncbi:CLL_HP2_G0010020.mRNA.1.CDS.1 [Saccharomyces cerevisiae]|nr:CLL_HP2_G0010020.mRNA.1.CDS.1 [Saccharomyces cerevisiae]CAI6407769.1 CLL_HP2_G0010020.mRNA.1.CDS.1 [Saccharomyces cerevisiae]